MYDNDDLDSTQVNRDRRDLPASRLPPGMRGRLEFVDGPHEGRVELVEQPYASIGRSKRNTIPLDDTAASSNHALIMFTQGLEWRIADQGSTNGTLLNGHQVKEYALRDNDKILIGDSLIRFNIERV